MEVATSQSTVRKWPRGLNQPLIGRDQDESVLVDMLSSASSRIVTLTGPGGVGKTSLAMSVAERLRPHFDDRVDVVVLAALVEPAHLLYEIAHQLGLSEHCEAGVFEALVERFTNRNSLLLLDNFEQLIEASPDIARLSAAAPALRLLITSREALNIRHERTYQVSPLAVGRTGEFHASPAEELFLRCAARAGASIDPGDLAIRAICQRLDGLPLAIELASTWTSSIGPAAISGLLDRQLDALRSPLRDMPDRHRTMRAAISWSYELLAPDEQHFFRAVSTFNGPFSIEAAACLAGVQDVSADTIDVWHQIATLTSKNLLRPVEVAAWAEERYELLETVRAFGREESVRRDEFNALGNRHARYELDFVEAAVEKLISPERIATLQLLDREYSNIRAALSWLIDHADAEPAHRLLASIWRYWEPRGLLHEGISWAEAVLAIPAEVDTETRAWALYGAAVMPMRQGEFGRARELAMECQRSFQAIDHRRGMGFALNILGILAYDVGNFAGAISTHRQALELRKEEGEAHLIETSTVNLAIALFMAGELDEAETLYQQAYEMETARGHSHGIAFALNGLGLVAEQRSDLPVARARHERAVALRRGEDTGSLAASLVNLASVLRRQGAYDDALRSYQEAIGLRHQRGEMPGLLEALEGVAYLAADLGRTDSAAVILATVKERRTSLGINKVDPFRAGSIGTAMPIGVAEPVGIAQAVEMALGLRTSVMDGEADKESPQLTSREREVLSLIATGLSDQEIADELFIARVTVSRHVANIFTKLGVTSRTAATAWSLRQELELPETSST